jgi:hypothetical protein
MILVYLIKMFLPVSYFLCLSLFRVLLTIRLAFGFPLLGMVLSVLALLRSTFSPTRLASLSSYVGRFVV